MTEAELRAHMATTYAAEIKAEIDRAEAERPLIRGSDAALTLSALGGDALNAIVRERVAAERQSDQPSQAA